MKQCRFCGGVNHTATFCFARPKGTRVPRKKIRQLGKYGHKWLKYRAEYLAKLEEPYICYLCGDHLKRSEITLDHIIPRSRRPDLRFEDSNIAVCCWRCNKRKGSQVYH